MSPLPTGVGTSPDIEMAAGAEPTVLPPRPIRAISNDALCADGIVAEGNLDGTIDLERKIPWL